MITASTNADQFRRSVRRTGSFVYQHSPSLVVISVCWVVGSFPLVTSGLATLGAYTAINSMRNGQRIETKAIRRTLRRHGLNATLMSIVPVVIGVLTIAYFYRYIVTDSIQYILLSIVGVYLFSFLLLISLTTFALLSDENTFSVAVKNSYRWVIHNPLHCIVVIFASGVLVFVGIVSIVGLVIIIPAVLFSFHLEVIQNSSTLTAEKDNF